MEIKSIGNDLVQALKINFYTDKKKIEMSYILMLNLS